MSTSHVLVQNKIQNLHNLQFPWKLHRLLEEAELTGDSNIVSWLPGNKAFKVHNRQEFATRIMPAYFSSAKYKTFQRSLNLWGFESVSKGHDKGACFHKFFLRGHPNLCENMRRVKIKGQQTNKGIKDITPSIPALSATSALHATDLMAAIAEPNISDFIRRRTSLDNSGGSPKDSELPQATIPQQTSALSILQNDMILKAAIERQRQEALLRLQLQTQLPALNFGAIPNILQQTQNNVAGHQHPQQQQQQDPLHTVAIAAALASKVIHEV